LIRELIVTSKIIVMSDTSSWNRSADESSGTDVSMLLPLDNAVPGFSNVQQRQPVVNDYNPVMLPSTTITTSITSQQQQQQQHQKVVHYPECMQLGKRKFQSDNDETIGSMKMSHHPQVMSQYEATSTTSSTTITKPSTSSNIDDNDAGLSLLFAASLIQQQGNSHSSNNYINHNVVDAATTEKQRTVSYDSIRIDPLSTSQESYGISTRSIEMNCIDSADKNTLSSNKDMEFIEPTAHDGMFVKKHIVFTFDKKATSPQSIFFLFCCVSIVWSWWWN
jgi:hypothetical protein